VAIPNSAVWNPPELLALGRLMALPSTGSEGQRRPSNGRFQKAPHEYGISEALQGCGNPLFPHLRSDQRHFQRPSPKSKFLAFITTDSVPQASGDKVHVVSIAPLLGEAIRRIHGGQSITTLFSL